ncbi:MAG: glycosyltransferase, partial [Bacteroidetes bacterium]|nr:glycosyltransferase [Bacteroidota bacterium]
AASRGFPIVSTAAGVSGAHLKHEQHVLIADSADEFSAAVLRFFENPDLARRLGNSARALAEKYFNREVVDASWVRHIVPGA